MKRTATHRSSPSVPPVQKVEVREGQTKKRVVLLIVAIAVALGAFGYGIASLVTVKEGWYTIEAASASEMNCAQDFTFQYYLGASGISAAAENKEITTLYSQATAKAYALFTPYEAFPEENNLFTLNHTFDEPVTVDPALYYALSQAEKSGTRYIYLGPAYEQYNSLFFCNEDWETEGFDPYQNADIRQYLAEVAVFAQNPADVQVQLLGNNQVKLHVSDRYMAFARENGIQNFVDFYFMKNAFIIDYLARTLEEKGYNRGFLSSHDGFTRCLSEEALQYSCFFFTPTDGQTVVRAGQLSYPGDTSLVQLHAMRFNDRQERYYYQFADGQIRTPYLDVKDGLNKETLPVLMATAKGQDCGEMLLQLLPFYATDSLDRTGLMALSSQEIYPLFVQEGRIITTDPSVSFTLLDSSFVVSAE